ncbi:hypothetical protein [Thermococcus sp.]|uniref:hypothetical protein n=1 Tax=Thermococcus sp. TaxID=35749 RepID=UPI00262FA00F|nr:hypothetical protein [Thermococcus sp.]
MPRGMGRQRGRGYWGFPSGLYGILDLMFLVILVYLLFKLFIVAAVYLVALIVLVLVWRAIRGYGRAAWPGGYRW